MSELDRITSEIWEGLHKRPVLNMNNVDSLNGGVEYPINDTGYSGEKLCEQLSICRFSKIHSSVFNNLCSGSHNECKYKVCNL